MNNMKILVTGSNGFIGKHISILLNRKGYDVLSFDKDDFINTLKKHLSICDFVIALAGINRPVEGENYLFNFNHIEEITYYLRKNNRQIPIIFASSIQAELNNDYGVSKRFGEQIAFESGLPVYVYRLKNVFGKWCRSNYNSAVATFCYNIAHDLPIQISDRNNIVHYNYIDDICNEFLKCIEGINKPSKDILYVEPSYDCSLGYIVDTLYSFKKDVESDKHIPDINNEFELKLFETFCDYLSDEGNSFNYSEDNRGSFKEIYKSDRYGQISINIIKPGITKGGHYHKYKNEIFKAVVGNTVTRIRDINTKDIKEYKGKDPVYITPGHTHDIKNIGTGDSATLMWISHIYKEETSDTYKEDVDL